MQLIFRPDLVYTEFTKKGLELHLQSNHGPTFTLLFDEDTLGHVVGDLLGAYGWEQGAQPSDEPLAGLEQQALPF